MESGDWYEHLIKIKNLYLKNDDIAPNDEDAIFAHEAKVLGYIDWETKKFLADIEREYSEQLKYKRKNKFPYGWMLNDTKIKAMMDSHPPFTSIANYLRELNKNKTPSEIKKLIIDSDKIMGGKRYILKNKEYRYSIFVTNNVFYEKAIEALNISKNTLQLYLKVFAKIGIIEEKDDKGQYGKVYADGYFFETNNGSYRKISFLKNTPVIRHGLRNLPAIRNYE